MAIVCLLLFMIVNNKWLQLSNEELYNFSIGVASSKAKDKDKMVKLIKKIITKYLRPLK